MKKAPKQPPRRRPRAPVAVKAAKWLAALGVLALIGYGATHFGGVAYDENAIRVVDFSGLSDAEKHSALQAANGASCTCGCGLTLAQCVATDSTCPIREPNIERIKTMVRNAKQP
jgi:hypothetical protein